VDLAEEEKEENKKTEIKWETGKKRAKEEKEKISHWGNFFPRINVENS
jgi:hypothetical protein